ncbi:MAG: MFS transporter [Bacteroidales bacterium]|jgi:AAA family ATP:ADP antiporter|nr:MFS transporter [Bacteroidales bacterium]
MKKDVYAIFNIEQNERISVSLFLFQSIFLGIFYGAFDVGAHALFLSAYPASMIPKAYVISGLVGIVLTSIYARLQSKYKFSSIAIFNLIFISLSTALLRVLFQFTESSWLIFLIFIMMGPLNIMALLGFWGGVGRMFSLRQGKRLFGLIDSGQIFGAILSTFAIPVLIAVGFQQKNLLFLSSVSVVCALLMQIVISIKYNLNQVVTKKEKKSNRLPDLLKNKYILYMSIFVVISMLTAFFIQFSFLSVTKENYPDHNDLAEFLGAFTGSLLLFTFLFKTFLYSKLMKTYGLKVSILISAFLLGIFTAIASLIGTFVGYTTAASGFLFFFLIIALSRLFSKALKDAVEVPSFKILYQSLKAEIRHDVQAYVDGTINEIAALAAGLILAALSLFEFFKLIHFSYTLMLILVIWFFVARKLYVEYKISLQKSLAEYKGKKEEIENVSDFIDENLLDDSIDFSQIISGLDIDFELHPLMFEEKMEGLINHKQKLISDYAFQRVKKSRLIDSYKYLPKNEESLMELLNRTDIKIDKSPGIEKLIEISKAKGTEERILAAHLIGKFYEPKLYVYLKALIRDLQISVKIAAIKAASKTKNTEFCSLIIDYLDTPGLISYSYDSLSSFGEEALSIIDQYFYKTGTSHRISLRIVKLIGQIGGNKAQSYLIKKLDHPNEEILNYVLLALKNIDFIAEEKVIIQIHQIIEKHIGVMAYNISTQATLNEIEGYEYLKTAFKEELSANYNLLYLLLSLAYDSKSIMHVKDNIESATTEGISYALELLDLFIHEELKPKLFPVVEDISVAEKIKQLQNYYPIERLAFNDLLISIINRDINEINIWTKVCAILAFSEIENKEISNDLIAHLFNPHEILRETAGIVINGIDTEYFKMIGKRLNQQYREELDNSIELLNVSKNHLIVEKTFLLKSFGYFKNIDGRYLYEFAKSMNNLSFESYELSDIVVSDLKDKVLLLKGESALLSVDDKEELELVEGELYDMNEILKDAKRKVSLNQNGENTIYYINKNDMINNMFDFHKIEIAILNWINIKISKN